MTRCFSTAALRVQTTQTNNSVEVLLSNLLQNQRFFFFFALGNFPPLRSMNSSKALSQIKHVFTHFDILTHLKLVQLSQFKLCRMSEVFKKKFHQHLFPAHNWSSSMKEVYFGESSILDSVDRSPHVHPLLHCCCGNLCPALCAAAIKQLYFVERGGWRRPVGWKVNYRHSVDDENH